MNLITPTKLARIISEKTGEPFTRQAVHKSLDEGRLPFTLSGKKKMVDLDNKDVQLYITDLNRQREQAKKKDIPSELREKKQQKNKERSKLPDENNSDLSGLSAFELKQRKQIADTRIAEAKAAHIERRLVASEFVLNYFIKYVNNLNTNCERIASTGIQDIGSEILLAGEVKPAHIEKFTNMILEVCHNTREKLLKELEEYEPR